MTQQVPLVDHLVLNGEPHLVGHCCEGCGATFLERRNACAGCGGEGFRRRPLANRGRIESFTVVHRGAPKATGPFVSVVVCLDDGVYVKANLLGVEPEPDVVDFTRPVRLQTFVAGTDGTGVEAVAYGFAYEEAG